MTSFTTIHIFKVGIVQIISSTLNKSVPATGLTALTPFVSSIQLLKPADVVVTPYHVIHINYGNDIRYLGSCTKNKADKLSFSVKWVDINMDLLDTLVSQIISA